jgi:predicted DNA-binding protein with PD1-like motif
VKSERSEKSRHIVLRAEVGDVLPDALLVALREHGVTAGWVRASGVLSEIELRAYGADLGGYGEVRRVAGPAHALTLDACIGVADGDVSLSLRGVFGRETDRGMETLAGDLVRAKVVALEVLVTALDDLALPRAIDRDAGIWMLGDPTGAGRPGANSPGAPRQTLEKSSPLTQAQRPASPAWSEAIAASGTAKERAPAGPVRSAQGIPQRLVRPEVPFDDNPVPEAGDIVEHFAFGVCEVLKSEGDRLHLKVTKDARIREIALEMLRVTLISTDPATEGKRRYKLDRKI